MKKTKEAVSLIVLVLTIVIMIILGGIIIINLSNSGLIEKGDNVVKENNKNQIQELASIGWAVSYSRGARTESALYEGVIDYLESSGITEEERAKYKLLVTTSGVTIAENTGTKWFKNGNFVVKGNQILKIGDTIYYDATNNNKISGLTPTEWKIIGADKDGNLLIMSTEDIVKDFELGSADDLEAAQQDWLTARDILDDVCEPYGAGKSALGARTVTVEDIDEICGYNKTMYQVGKIFQYGNEVDYLYTGSNMVDYDSVTKNGTLKGEHNNGFYYYEGEDFSMVDDLETTSSGKIITLKSGYYYYYGKDQEIFKENKNSELYEFLFGNDDAHYWLGESYTNCGESFVNYGIRCMEEGGAMHNSMWYSDGRSFAYKGDVRAVVTLSADVNLNGSSETGWSY